MSGGITISTTDGASQAELPFIVAWVVKIPRSTVSATSLDGSKIHQTTTKSTSAGTVSYTGWVPKDEADTLKTIDDNNSSVILADGKAVYEAIMDATVSQKVKGGRKYIEASFAISRKIL